eukprot:COSAG06_NODE_10092_length_1751_cov_2.421913_1_plen_118_part_00
MTVRVAHALGGEREDAQGQGYREYVAHHQNLFALLYTRPPTHLATRECTIAWLGRPAGPAVGRATAAAALARAGGGGGGPRGGGGGPGGGGRGGRGKRRRGRGKGQGQEQGQGRDCR